MNRISIERSKLLTGMCWIKIRNNYGTESRSLYSLDDLYLIEKAIQKFRIERMIKENEENRKS